MKSKLTAGILVMLLYAILCGAAFAQDTWPTFHQDDARSGASDVQALNTLILRPTWVFPYPEKEIEPVDDGDTGFAPSGAWTLSDPGLEPSSYNDDYLWTVAEKPQGDPKWETWQGPWAAWTFAPALTKQVSYLVYVWFPSSVPSLLNYRHTRDAHYMVLINGNVVGRYTLDQSGGGAWINLGNRPFQIGPMETLQVRVTNETQDDDSDGKAAVVADAVKIVQDSGTILSSPVMCPTRDILVAARIESRPLDNTPRQDGSRNVGVVYGIATEADVGLPSADDRGFETWHWPFNLDNWVEGGFSSTPTIADIGGSTDAAVIPAHDGQVYVISTDPAAAPRLIAQGPGVIDDNPSGGGAWVPGTHAGYQGADYLQAPAVFSGGSTVSWSVPLPDPGSYAVYAWIPPSTTSQRFVPDAHYVVTSGSEKIDVRISQANGGAWARIGYLKDVSGNVRVALDNKTLFNISAGNYYVAADAIKVVRAPTVTVDGRVDRVLDPGSFDFSSPIVDGDTIYVGSTNGRLYALEVNGASLDIKWTFPRLDESPLGLITASPALRGGTLYIGTGDGHVYAVNSGGGTRGWVYPGDGDPQGPLGEISSTTAVGSLIYVGIGGSGPTIPGMGGTTGSVIALTTAGGLAWTYTPVTQSAAGFLHSSPALLANQALVIGGTDGYLYGLNPDTGRPLWWDAADPTLPDFPSLGNPIWSSPAVTRTSGTDPPGAYVGTLGAKISCVNLSTGEEFWSWNLLGSAVSSPAICKHRVYIGDLNGYTWGFGDGMNGSGGTDYDPLDPDRDPWNQDVGPESPTSGSVAGAGGRKADPEAEAFTRSEFRRLLADLVTHTDLGKGRDPDLHKEPLGFPDPNEAVHQYEWGEEICVIVWNLLDPHYVYNPNNPNPPTVKPGDPTWDPDFRNKMGTVKVTLMSEDGGTAEERTISKNDMAYFLDANDNPVYYAKCVYTLDGSAGNKTQTPGSRIVINVTESPSSAHRGDATGAAFVPKQPVDMAIPKDERKRQFFSINNPLGLVYPDPDFSQANTVRIGVEMDGKTTKRNSNMASVNGNTGAIPFVRPEPTTHGTTSSLREVVICDRSLLGSSNMQISKFRVERKDLRWASTPMSRFPSQPLPWEVPPPAQPGLPNISPDYPDISARQTSCVMESSGMDPAQEVVELIASPSLSTSDPRTVGLNGMGITITVPRFQPANLPKSDIETDRRESGYLGMVYAYVDSDGNGHLTRPSATARAALQMKVSGLSTEAYREFVVQTHVPVDRRVEIQEKVIDIGQVPHGFGCMPTPQGPTPFLDTLTLNVSNNPAQPGTFESWFKQFQAENIGNTNLWNLRFATYVKPPQPYPEYWLGLTSDTVQDGYGGYFIPGRWVVTALDDEFLDDLDVRPLVNVPGAKRTFHKPRVGDQPTELRIPDSRDLVGMIPRLSVAVPIGQPVGTYHGKFTLFEDDNQDGKFDLRAESVGNPIVELVISTTEARMTDGFTAGALPHIDVGPPPHDTGDMTAAAYRDPMTGNLHMFWASSRYAQSQGIAPEATQPWYLYRSTLPWRTDPTGGGWWEFANANPGQWWQPVDPASPFPAPASLDTLFLGSMVGPGLGAPGQILANSVKFTSPSVTIDEYSGKSWLFFSGQAYKESDTLGPGQDKAIASRVFYTEIEDGRPVGQGYTSTKDWTMPKLGVRGQASRIDGAPWLWSFWYGGSNDRWKIFYNVNPEPDNEDAWTNEALLPVPKGLTSVAEPSPIFRWSLDLKTRDVFDVVYTGYSSFHKNSDIYLSRFKPGTQQASQRSGGHWPLSLQRLPPRMRRVPIGNVSKMGEELTRDAISAVWYSRDVDWWYSQTVAWNADGSGNPDFKLQVYPDRHDPNVSLKINIGPYSKDQASGTLTFTYDDPSLVDQRTQFRAVVIDPAAGTVRFLRSPGKNALVFLEKYYPRAYRLTTDDAADVSPFAVLDDDPNPRYNAGKQNNPFFLSGNWDPDDPPATDRLWVLWRRPGLDKPGTGIHYKTFRYMVQLDYQMACSPLTGPIVQNVAGTKAALKEPVEIDWVRNRLYFTSEDASDSAGAGVTIPKQVAVTYVDATGVTRTDELHYVEFTEEMGLRGSAFGNLTRLMVNEGQISAFKDPMENKVWAFWTSTRSGNTDIYYEALSPRFHGVEY